MKNLNSLFAAYLAVWAIFFIYWITVARRVSRLEGEVRRLRELLRSDRLA